MPPGGTSRLLCPWGHVIHESHEEVQPHVAAVLSGSTWTEREAVRAFGFKPRLVRKRAGRSCRTSLPFDFLNLGNLRVSSRHGSYRYGGLQMTDNNSTALITGGTSGIGLATAKKLAELGIHVLVVGRNGERGKKAVDEIRRAEGKADFIASELLGADSAREVARKAIELGSGHVDILINNAGIYPFGPTHAMT